ncbi:MAG: hypothetical protein PQJ60_11645, partial [Spirochaetales bacterium]|nr:hypothetical protein [Spirochaetales bacterium]
MGFEGAFTIYTKQNHHSQNKFSFNSSDEKNSFLSPYSQGVHNEKDHFTIRPLAASGFISSRLSS